MKDHYDVIIIGAGPGGAFTAYELKEKDPSLSVLLIEKGRSIRKRVCPKRTNGGKCMHCKPCSITTGFSGAGAFSDGKLSLSPDVGGTLPDILGYDRAEKLIHESDEIYLKFGADTHVWGVDKEKEIREIRQKAIRANLKLIECPIRHLGTEKGYEIYQRLEDHLESEGVEMLFNTSVAEILLADDPDGEAAAHWDGYRFAKHSETHKNVAKIGDSSKAEGKKAIGVRTMQGDVFYAPQIVCAVGREGADWLDEECRRIGIESVPGPVDIGVRVEVRDEIMQFLNENLYEAKLVFHTPTFDDKVRTFCTNPSGVVATEYYDNNLAVVNGHAYSGDEYKTHNTNFALLVSKNFTKPFNTPIEYGRRIAELSNMLCGNRILVQTFGDFRRGRRSTDDRMCRNNIIPTLKDAVPGDLSLVFPHRIMVDLEEMIYALDKVTPGLASDETLLYGVEVKFYSNRLVVNDRFETSVPGLYAIGDGAGITRGLQQASANGLCVARSILDRK